MAANEAAEKWGISDSRIRQKIADFPNDTIRKFGKQWVVTEQGMNLVFGKRKEVENDMDQLAQLIRKDIEKPVCKWTENDKRDWRDMGWRVPSKCTCDECKSKGQ